MTPMKDRPMGTPHEQTVLADVHVRERDYHGDVRTHRYAVEWDRTGIVLTDRRAAEPNYFFSEIGMLVSGLSLTATTTSMGVFPWYVPVAAAGFAVWGGTLVALMPRRRRSRRAALSDFQHDWRTLFDSTPPERVDREWAVDGVAYRVKDGEVVSLPAHRDPRITAAASSRSRTDGRYTLAVEQHEQIKTAYGAILSDPIEVLLHSALMDTTNPHTEQFVLALYTANDLATTTRPSNAAEDEYTAAVHRLRVAWDNARGSAQKHGATWMPVEDQQRSDTALGLLRHSASTGLTDAERITYLAKAYALIRDISVLRLDPRTVTALEAATGKAITG